MDYRLFEEVKEIVEDYLDHLHAESVLEKTSDKDWLDLDQVKNEYNLNISRYVSTAEPEQIINIEEVNNDLVAIENTITIAKAAHNKFLKELGLKVLP